MMATRLQRDIDGRALRLCARRFQRLDLGVSLAGAFMPTFANDVTVAHQHTADPGVGIGAVEPVLSQRQRPRHMAVVIR
jgi:hypothetical protein